MSLMYKAFLYEKRTNKPKEIRRFSVDHDVSSSYEYLRKKVATVFPDLSEENFHLQWHDSDGDLIWFNSDEELIEALSEHQGGLFKLMIQEKQSSDAPNNNDGDEGEDESSNNNRRRWGRKCGRGGRPYWCGPMSSPFHQYMYNQFKDNQSNGCGPFGPKMDNGNSTEDNKNQGSNGNENQSFPTGEEYLKNVGSAVSDFLKPFGIDVDVSVDHNGVRTSCSTRQPGNNENAQKGTNTGSKDEQPTCSKNTDDEKSTKSQESGRQDQKSAEKAVPITVVHENKLGSDAKQENNSGQSSDEGEWTVVKDEDGDNKNTDANVNEKSSTSGKSSPAEKLKKEKPEKNKSNGTGSGQPGPLDLLLAMGFKDENGQLARLLQICQNDIGKVLENMEKNMKG